MIYFLHYAKRVAFFCFLLLMVADTRVPNWFVLAVAGFCGFAALAAHLHEIGLRWKKTQAEEQKKEPVTVTAARAFIKCCRDKTSGDWLYWLEGKPELFAENKDPGKALAHLLPILKKHGWPETSEHYQIVEINCSKKYGSD